MADFTWKPNLLDAIHMTSSAWNQVLPETISKCFRKSWGNIIEETSYAADSDDEDDIPLAILRERLNLDSALNFNDYLNVDRDLATSDTDSEESIWASLNGQSPDVEEEDLREEVSATPLTTSDALARIHELQTFFTKMENVDDDHFRSLAAIETLLMKRTSLLSQPVITSFFTRP